MIVLDTDLFSDLEWETSDKAQKLLERLRAASEVAVTVISLEEQMRGWMSSIASKKSVAEQVEVYRRLKRRLAVYCKIPVLDFAENAARRFDSFRKAKIRIDTMDLKIACVVLDNNATLYSHNAKDFVKVPGLRLEIIK